MASKSASIPPTGSGTSVGSAEAEFSGDNDGAPERPSINALSRSGWTRGARSSGFSAGMSWPLGEAL